MSKTNALPFRIPTRTEDPGLPPANGGAVVAFKHATRTAAIEIETDPGITCLRCPKFKNCTELCEPIIAAMQRHASRS